MAAVSASAFGMISMERRGTYSVLVGKREGKRKLGRPKRRWEDNIKTDLQVHRLD